MLVCRTRTLASRVYLSQTSFTKTLIICSSYSTNTNTNTNTTTTTSNSVSSPTPPLEINSKDVALSFKNWFKSRDTLLLDRIFDILASKDEDLGSAPSAELELTRLGLRLSEKFVLKVLKHGKDVLSCLKFFDWAGRQNGYNHQRSTYTAIFKILSRAKLMPLMLDFLETFKNTKYMHKVRFNDTLVIGYAVVGKPDIALQLFGKMRFQGLDLDDFAYHVLLNALVEEGCSDAVDVIYRQIAIRGFDNELTMRIRVKNFIKHKKLKEAEEFIHGLWSNGVAANDHTVALLVDAFCKRGEFDEAGRLVEAFPGPHTYGIWIRDLVQAGKVDGAMGFLRSNNSLEGYVPDVYRYNVLVCRLLKEMRLDDVYDLLMEMREAKISPDKVTMNATLCFFCKAGKVDVALELYSSRSEFGLSLNSLTYNYLINTLCGDGSVDEAYKILKDSVERGYFLGKKTFAILADALYREGKLDKMTELVNIALDHSVMPNDAGCVKFISALYKARREEDGYLIYGELNRMYKVSSRLTFIDLLQGLNRSNRRDMAYKLLIEMQEHGHTPSRALYRAVIGGIFTTKYPENQFFKLLDMQVSRQEPSCQLYNFYIDAAGHAKRPDLAREVYEMMSNRGVEPNSASEILMLQSYLKSNHVSDALNFCSDLCKKKNPGKRFYNAMIVGLCKTNKPVLAFEILREVREKGLIPSLECYEELVLSFCLISDYDRVVEVMDDFLKTGHSISSFIGNTLLLSSLTSRELYKVWVRSGIVHKEASSSDSLTLIQLVGLFSGGFRTDQHLEKLDEEVEQCFPLDTFTYNMLLRRMSMAERMDKVFELFNRMRERGYQPDRWTYNIIAHSRTSEAERWANEMRLKRFVPTEFTR